MTTESIWTALPNGRARTILRLSVHMAPRLIVDGGGEGTLAEFPAFVTWPPGDLAFEVVFPGFTYPATVVSSPDPTLWPKVFPPSSAVRSFEPVDRSQIPVHTYPITKIAAFLQDQYTDAALNSPEFFPSIDGLLQGGFEDIRFSGRDGALKWQQALSQLQGLLQDNKVVDTTSSSTPTFDFVQLKDFFAPVDVSDPANEAVMTAPVEPPSIDFHGAVQFLNHHPALMRLLGLVFDLEIDLGTDPGPSGSTTIQVVPTAGLLAGTTVRTPRTHCAVGIESFVAEPHPTATHLAPGFLRLDDPTQFAVVPVEADGGGLKAVDYAGNLKRRQLHPTEDTPTDSGLPSLRADGLAVARTGAAQKVHDKLVLLTQQEGQLSSDALELWADDLVRGVRVDVHDSASGGWHSLMHRVGSYELEAGSTVIPVEDEGFIGTTATKKPVAEDLYLSEEVFWWDGWSLVVPRPGRALTIDPQAEDPLIDRPPNSPGPEFDVSIHFDIAPGTLPRLRYGTGYRFRARTVDLAGNSAGPDDPDETHASSSFTFGRFEPPQTPPVLLRTPRGPGESSETVALRSNFDAAPSPATAQRHLAPAKVGQLSVEEHGLVDVPDPNDPSQIVVDAGAYQMLADRDAASLLTLPYAAVDPNDNGDTRYFDVEQLDVTWPPDPAARRLALRYLDGPNAGFLDTYPLIENLWPDHRAIRMVVVEGAGLPSFDPTSRVLTVPLEKADVVHARLSAVLDPGDLEQFGLWHWVLDGLPAGPAGEQKMTELIALIRSGQHWMFEPFRILTLIHAVRQPLARPEFPIPPGASRGLGDTFARLSGFIEFSRKSTNRIDVLASWQEPVDLGPGGDPPPANVGEPGAIVVDRQTAVTLDIEQDEAAHPTREDLRHRHEFGDTKHRMVTYRAVASTRFPEFFTQRQEFEFGGPNSQETLDTGSPAQGLVPGSVKVTHHPEGGVPVPLIQDVHFTVDHDAGTIAFGDGTQGALPPTGDPIVAVYLVPPVTRETADPPSEPGEFGPRLVNVPSSARPQAPKILYAIPTFGWERGDFIENGEVAGVTSTRRGNGLRVYLERPWWTSGEGELLGVVLWPPGEQEDSPDLEDGDPPDRRRAFVTQWGQDPIYGSVGLPHRYPRLSDFPDAAATGTGLTLEELGSSISLPVNVAGHEVGFDGTIQSGGRDLWFCDITLDPGLAYSPFVRLALARYQPSSIPNAHLSRVALADFVQLAPDRAATVVFDDAEDSIMTVVLAGPTHGSTEASDGTHSGTARVIVEKRRTDFDGELAWEPVGNPIDLTGAVVGGLGQWFGEVHLPGPRTPDTWRLVVEQFELLGDEPEKKPQLANPFLRTTPVQVPRLVHTDVIPI